MSNLPSLTHKNRHAAGGPDALSPSDIGAAPVASTWLATTAYKAGQLVTSGGKLWQSKTDHTSGASFSGATNWNLIASLAAIDLTGLGGAATLNVGTTAGTVMAGNDGRVANAAPVLNDRGAWAASTVYAVSDAVTYSQFRYVTKTPHTSTSTFDATKFVLLGSSESVLTNVEGLSGFAYGHSYVTGTGSTGGANGWAQRLTKRMRLNGMGNQGVGGQCMADTCTSAARTWSVGAQGIVYVESVINDAQQGGGAQSVLGFTNAVRSLIEIVRCGAKIEDTVPTYTGTWTASTTDTAASGSTNHSTTTSGDSFTMNIQGTAFTLFFFGNDDTNFGTAGGTVQVQVDGTTVATQSLSNQMAKTTYIPNQSKVHVPIIVTGLAPGYHIVKCTKTDATGSIVAFDFAVTPATYPVEVVLVKDGPVPGKGFTSTIVNAYNNVLDTMTGLYPAGQVISPAIPAAWDGVSTICLADGLHPGDYGHEVILNNLVAATAAVPFRGGIGTPSLAEAAAAPTPSSPADTFNRADNANSLGVTSTGSVPWQVETAGGIWGISSNRAYQASGAGGGVSIETGKTDCTITATIAVGSASNYGVLFRYGDNGAGLVWFAGAGLYTITGGNLGSQVATPGNYTAGDTVQIITSGTSITFKKNGATLTTLTQAIGNGNTRHGFRSNGATDARFDDFSVA